MTTLYDTAKRYAAAVARSAEAKTEAEQARDAYHAAMEREDVASAEMLRLRKELDDAALSVGAQS